METQETTITETPEAEVIKSNGGNSGANSTSGNSGIANGTTNIVHLSIDEEKLKAESPSIPLGGRVSDSVFAHQQLMARNNIDISKLPKQIRTDIQFWNATYSRLKGDKSGKISVSLRKRSVLIAHSIQDWIEKDYPEKSEEEIQSHIKSIEDAAEAKRKADAEAKIKADAEAKAKADAAELKLQEERDRARRAAKSDDGLTPEQKQAKTILKSLDENGKIHYKELQKILGRSVGLSAVKVGEVMVLRNEYGTNYYYVDKQ